MKAAICYEFGEPLVVEAVEIMPLQMGEVEVKIAACAICHSDIHCIRGEWGGETPVVAGHEAAGIVTEVGSGVHNVQPGDRVVASNLRSCGRCSSCILGWTDRFSTLALPRLATWLTKNPPDGRCQRGISVVY